MSIISILCFVVAFIELICSVGYLFIALFTDLFKNDYGYKEIGILMVICYVVLYCILISFGSIRIMNHLTKPILFIITVVGYLNLVPITFSIVQLFYLGVCYIIVIISININLIKTSKHWVMIVVIILTIIIDILLFIHTLFSLYFGGYSIVCFLIFANKTYRKAPETVSTDDINFFCLNTDLSGDGTMYFSIAPGSTNHFRRRTIINDVVQLKNKSITTVMCCLTKNDLKRLQMTAYEQTLRDNDITYLNCPIVDFWVPSNRSLFDEMAIEVKCVMDAKGVVLVHCNSGKGRTGLFAAAVLSKIIPKESSSYYIEQIRLSLPGAFDTFLQRLYFHMYINKIY